MDPVILAAYKAAQQEQSFAFATIIETSVKGTPRKTGAKMIVLENGEIVGTIGGGIDEKRVIEESIKVIKRNKHQLSRFELSGKSNRPLCGGKYTVFIEPFIKQRHLIICGAGHIALPLSIITKMLNFKVSIIDNRKAWANKKRFPHADQIITGDYVKNLQKIPISSNTYIVIVTHGHEFDYDCLQLAIKTPAKYIGVISSHAKRNKFIKDLRESGCSPGQIKRLSIPIGIDIGAQTPEEIAVSITAELISKYNADCLNAKKFKIKQ